MKVRTLAISAAVALVPALVRAEAAHTHIVYSGQRLGSIAKRYHVTVEALCSVNGLRATDALHPGQRLVIPTGDDQSATPPARAERDSRASVGSRSNSRHRNATEHTEPATHRVESGQRLESIARRYGITVDALRSANGISKKDIIRPGQILAIPRPGESPEEIQAQMSNDARSYFRAPKRKGYLELASYNEDFKGPAYDKRGRLVPAAYASVSKVLSMTGSRPPLEPRLLRLLVQVSDTFGGRAIRVVSGYRTTSFFRDSRHKISHAVDFSIPGVPNEVLRDYLRTLPKVGVGYYPNSSFVHLDVREYSAYWVDYAGPGEAPRHTQHRTADDVDDSPDSHEEEPGDVPMPETTNQPGSLPSASERRAADVVSAPSAVAPPAH